MTQFRVMAAFAVAGLIAGPAAAQGKSGSHGGDTALHGRPATTGATQGRSGDATHGKSADATHGKSADATRGRSGDHDGLETESGSKHDRHGAGTATSTTTTGPTALAAKISSNPDKLARITAMLPPGMTLDQATMGFRNQGQFIAALNASKNRGVVFADLQKAMTVDGLSLGQAVRKLKTEPAPTPTGTTTTGTTTTGTTTTSNTAKS